MSKYEVPKYFLHMSQAINRNCDTNCKANKIFSKLENVPTRNGRLTDCFQDVILGNFLPLFQSFHIEILNSISRASNNLGSQKYFNKVLFHQNANLGQVVAKSEKVDISDTLLIMAAKAG